jgi:hypothetical protein
MGQGLGLAAAVEIFNNKWIPESSPSMSEQSAAQSKGETTVD